MTEFTENQSHIIISEELRSWAIARRDWNRIRANVSALESYTSSFETIGWALLGIGASAGVGLLALLTATAVPNYVWIGTWVAFLGPGIAGGIFILWLAPRERSALAADKQAILDDMDSISSDFERSAS